MISFQLQLEAALASFPHVAALMQMRWAWPLFESAHFIGLTLLFGSIAAWDLRLVGMVKDIPLAAFHRLVPFAVIGFVINMTSGVFFLMTFPDQYVYNSAFHLKMLCVLLAGLNVAVFYLTMFSRVKALGPGAQAPLPARASGAISLVLWVTVIICGRMITFFRPLPCDVVRGAARFLANCIVR